MRALRLCGVSKKGFVSVSVPGQSTYRVPDTNSCLKQAGLVLVSIAVEMNGVASASPRCGLRVGVCAAFVDTQSIPWDGSSLRSRVIRDMVVPTGAGNPLPNTPSALCAYTLPDIHTALTSGEGEQQELVARPGSTGGYMFPTREKLGLLLSACTLLVSVQVLLPRTL